MTDDPKPPIAPGPLSDPDGDGVPGVSWSAATIIIVVVVSLSTLLYMEKLPEEVLVLLIGGIGENIRSKVSTRRSL